MSIVKVLREAVNLLSTRPGYEHGGVCTELNSILENLASDPVQWLKIEMLGMSTLNALE
ncbi:MAG TPA: hypothetical protein PKD54_16510 [Pirellulaceae bacterium]|nr:hypothetical protein [Pirellulaceae bacterium]